MAEALTRAMAPLGGVATTGEIADFLRRECAQDLEDERGRIDRATEHLKEMAGRGVDVPDFNRKRARPVVETQIDLQLARSKRTQPFDPNATAADTSAVTSVGAPSSEVARAVRARRRGLWIGLIGLCLAGAAGIAGGIYVANQEDADGEPPVVVSQPAAPLHEAEPAPPPPAPPAPAATEAVAATADTEVKQEARAERKPSKPASGKTAAAPPAAPALPAGNGYLSMDTMPYSEVFVDGKSVGITPVIKRPLKPGKHSIRAVTQDGQTKKLSITVQSGKTTTKRIKIGED